MSSVICILRGAVLFIGRVPVLGFHSTLAAAAIAGMESGIAMRLEPEGEWFHGHSFVYNGSLSHETKFEGMVGIILADPGSEMGAVFARETSAMGWAVNPTWGLDLKRTCFEILAASSPDEYPALLSRRAPFNQLRPAREILANDRLVTVLRLLIQTPEDAVNVEELAAAIGMSPSWLQHEFRDVVGIPLRAFRKWFRIKAAAAALKDGASLADAALAGGFYDQAHFANSFREIFGITPSTVFHRSEPIRWFVEPQNFHISW